MLTLMNPRLQYDGPFLVAATHMFYLIPKGFMGASYVDCPLCLWKSLLIGMFIPSRTFVILTFFQ